MGQIVNIQEKFSAYRVVQESGLYNMFDPRARSAANHALADQYEDPMTREDWAFIMRNYEELCAKYERPEDKSVGDYWEGTGKYQEAYDKIWKEQVPSKGESDIQYVEAVRCIGRILYEYYNNGNCNAVDWDTEECDECGGSGYVYDADGEEEDCSWCCGECYVEGKRYLTDYYQECLDKVKWYTKEHVLVANLKKVMLARENTFSAKEREPYNLLCDAVMRKAIGL